MSIRAEKVEARKFDNGRAIDPEDSLASRWGPLHVC